MSDVVTPKPVPDPVKLLAQWMDWERGDAQPGQTLADLKRGGLRDLLESLAADPTGSEEAPAV